MVIALPYLNRYPNKENNYNMSNAKKFVHVQKFTRLIKTCKLGKLLQRYVGRERERERDREREREREKEREREGGG